MARANQELVETVLRDAPEWVGCLAYNEFTDRIVMRSCPPSHAGLPPEVWARSWRDHDDLFVLVWLQRELDMDVSRKVVTDAVFAVAMGACWHPVRAYLAALSWDGQERLAGWLPRYLGAPDTPYVRAVGLRWLVSAVARIREPGCEANAMLVLEGEHTLDNQPFAVLGGAWFGRTLADVGLKDAAMQLRGVWILGIEGLDAIERHGASRIQAFLARTHDRYRPAFGRHVVDQPRQCVFGGSAGACLRDGAGGRWFWPVRCTRLDLGGLCAARDQLWAEATARYERGERWWLDELELEAAVADKRAGR